MKATENLMEEHESIKLMLNVMEKIAENIGNNKGLWVPHFEKILKFIKGFADQCHHGKEENILFPALYKKEMSREDGPLGIVLHEHHHGREIIQHLSKVFEEYKNNNYKAANEIMQDVFAYVQLLRTHIEMENTVLFILADKLLNNEEQNVLYEELKKYEKNDIGISKQNEYHNILDELISVYL